MACSPAFRAALAADHHCRDRNSPVASQVKYSTDCIGEEAAKVAKSLSNGEVSRKKRGLHVCGPDRGWIAAIQRPILPAVREHIPLTPPC